MSRILVLLLVALSFGAAGCGGGSGSDESGSAGTDTVSAGKVGAEDVSGRDEVELELDDNYFEPKALTGEPGQTIKLELANEGDAEHNLSIDEQQIDQDVEAGEDADVTVTFPDSGTVTFYCKYHREAGMTGMLQAG